MNSKLTREQKDKWLGVITNDNKMFNKLDRYTASKRSPQALHLSYCRHTI